jgi:haloalkane dehalogenase
MSHPERHFLVSPEEYPFAANWFEYDGSWLHYIDEGTSVPVVMLHDNPVWSFYFRNVIKSLGNECRSIAPDYPGFGFSQHPQDYSYLPQDHAVRVRALIDHLALGPFVLAMPAWGAPIGLSIAVDRPQDIAGLVIGNAWAWPLDTPLFRIFSFVAGGPLGRYVITRHNWFVKIILPGAFKNPDAQRPEILHGYEAPFSTPESRIGSAVFPKALTHAGNWMMEIEAKLERLADKPAELVLGTQDPLTTGEDWVQRWRNHFPRVNVDFVEDAGFYVVEDAPERFAVAIRRVLAVL